MDQQKIGRFIKELRKEKGLTQEKTAEQFHVSRRTVSRWETGSNLPDLDVLIEMADYFEVDLRELLDGERTENRMNKDFSFWRQWDWRTAESQRILLPSAADYLLEC